MVDARRSVPRTDAVLADARVQSASTRLGRARVKAGVSVALEHCRNGRIEAAEVVDSVLDTLPESATSLRRVVNATGVLVHTNLGRAPLADAARAAIAEAAGYCDLEYDLRTGQRGSRGDRLTAPLRAVTGAEDALAVNNAAAALVLALAAVAGGREVTVSRGELIEIGGSFRLPEIMAASGARLVEVGTTNRTRAADHLAGDEPGAILSLHPSNYQIVGFVEQPTVRQLAEVARRRGVPLLFDAGSGLLTAQSGPLSDEPVVSVALTDGADIVLCSGDKLLGGPQAGLLLGRADLIARCRAHPLARAVRLDKLAIAALQATLELHLRDRRDDIPVWRMLALDDQTLHARCAAVAANLDTAGVSATVERDAGLTGGGAAPDRRLPGAVVAVDVERPDAVAERLRAGDPPVVGRINDGRLLLGLRTVDPADDDVLVAAVVHAAR